MISYTANKGLALVFSGKDYFETLEKLIDQAKEIIHLQTYIFETDTIGSRILSALKRAVGRGVKIFLLVDAFGSYPFDKKIVQELRQSGIRFRQYSPLFSSENIFFIRRLHHKVIVVDREQALIGGINISDKYYGSDAAHPWLDYAVYVKGEVCGYLNLMCERIFRKRSLIRRLTDFEKKLPIPQSGDTSLIRFRLNDWMRGKNEIYRSYINAIKNAEHSIVIVASYLLPGLHFRKLLTTAASRGVKIKIIFAGKSDIGTYRSAENYLYAFYLRNNIQLYEWTNSVLHGKAMVVDGKWSTIGSFNMNYLSHYISIELNADILDQGFTQNFTEHLEKIIRNDCVPINVESFEKKYSTLSKLKMWLAYNFYKLLMEVILMGTRYRIQE